MLKNFIKSIIRRRIPNRIAASTLVVTLTFVNIMLLGSYFIPKLNSYAAENLEAQTDSTQSPNVNFDAYFVESSAKVHSISGDISGSGKILYLNLHVLEGDTGGFLKDGTIQIKDMNRRHRHKF